MKNSSARRHGQFIARRYSDGVWLAAPEASASSASSVSDTVNKRLNIHMILSRIASVLVVLWVFGVAGLFYLGNFVHLLLLAAIALAAIRVSQEYNFTVNEYMTMFHSRAQEILGTRVLPAVRTLEIRARAALVSARTSLSSSLSVRSLGARKFKQLKV